MLFEKMPFQTCTSLALGIYQIRRDVPQAFLILPFFRRFTGRCLRAKRRGKLCSVNVVIENIMTCIFPPWWHLLCKFWRRFLFFFVDKVEMCQLNSWKRKCSNYLNISKCSNYFEMVKMSQIFWNVQNL